MFIIYCKTGYTHTRGRRTRPDPYPRVRVDLHTRISLLFFTC